MESTPVKVADSNITARHRVAFNNAVFAEEDGNTNTPNNSRLSSKVWSQAEYGRRLTVCDPANWGVGLLTDMEDEERGKIGAFRRNHPDGCNWTRFFTVVNASLPTRTPIKRLARLEVDKDSGKQKPGRIVVSPGDIFQCIAEVHSSVGHKKVGATHHEAALKYWNISRVHVQKFIDLCPVCNQQQPRVRKTAGVLKAIRSHSFRDRFQVDLIDMRTRKKKNVYGQMMRWIMTTKDHSTRLTHLTALPLKQAKFVAHELDQLMGLIGYPIIFHTDNGTEFIAKVNNHVSGCSMIYRKIHTNYHLAISLHRKLFRCSKKWILRFKQCVDG